MEPVTILIWLAIILVGGYIALQLLGLLVAIIAAPFVARSARKAQRDLFGSFPRI